MQLKEAIKLIKHQDVSAAENQVWADLGCGTGTFTLALASLLCKGSTIYAVDTDKSGLNKIPDKYDNVDIIKMPEDFSSVTFPGNMNGILMANSLHFVNKKDSFVKRISTNLKTGGCFLIVEYDIDGANPWVPFPINFDLLTKLFNKAGFNSVVKLAERPSAYQRGNIYSAIIKSFS